MECTLVELLRESDQLRGTTRREIERRNHVPVQVVQELLLLPDNVDLEHAETMKGGENFPIKEATKEEEDEKLEPEVPPEPPELPETLGQPA